MLPLYMPAAIMSVSFLAYRLGYFPLATVFDKVGLSGIGSFLQQHSSDNVRVLFLAAALSVHFTKRVLEVLFLHRYSGSMDASHGIVISLSYGLIVFNLLYTQQLSSGLTAPPTDLMWIGIPLFAVGIIGNFYHHYILSKIRKDGNNKYVLPRGGLFEKLVCPHYIFEDIDFLGMAMISQTIMAFAIFTFVIIYLTGRTYNTKQWYMKKVDGFPSERKLLIPKVF